MFQLFVDSASPINVHVEWSAVRQNVKDEWVARSSSGRLLKYRHGSHQRIRLPIRYVNSSTRAIVDSWWLSDADLFLVEEGVSDVFSVHITNTSRPFEKSEKPYQDRFSGVIELEGVFDQLADLPLTEPSTAFPDPWDDSFVWADDLTWVEA